MNKIDKANANPDRVKQQLAEVYRSVKEGHWWGTITSEPGSGGDVTRSQATARRAGGKLDYRLTGRKHFGSGKNGIRPIDLLRLSGIRWSARIKAFVTRSCRHMMTPTSTRVNV